MMKRRPTKIIDASIASAVNHACVRNEAGEAVVIAKCPPPLKPNYYPRNDCMIDFADRTCLPREIYGFLWRDERSRTSGQWFSRLHANVQEWLLEQEWETLGATRHPLEILAIRDELASA